MRRSRIASKEGSGMLDIRILGGTVVDGTGRAGFYADVGVQDGKIAVIGNLSDVQAARTIDARGCCVTPGFIDIHRHADARPLYEDFGKAELMQGLTTVVNGNCGLSSAPCPPEYRRDIYAYLAPVTGRVPENLQTQTLEDYFAQMKRLPLRINVGMLAGLGTLRAGVCGYAPVMDEAAQNKLRARLETALGSGVLGISLGLGYAPESFFSTQELIDALQPMHKSGIPITVHMRQEGSEVTQALAEMLTVARVIDTPVEISHLKAIGRVNWRSAVARMLQMLRLARQDGLSVGCDVYPYPAGSTQLVHILPPELQYGGAAAITRHLHDAAFRARARERMQTGDDFENIVKLVGWEHIVLSSLNREENRPLTGKSVAEAAELLGKEPYDCAFDLLESEACAATMIDFITDEADITEILQAEFSCVISDATYPDTGLWHPRVYGAFARMLRHFVRETRALTLPEAVYKMAGRPAEVLGLVKKGRIAAGLDADVCVFDPNAVCECGTYQDPAQYARGMRYVLVNGQLAVENGAFADCFSGRVVTHE